MRFISEDYTQGADLRNIELLYKKLTVFFQFNILPPFAVTVYGHLFVAVPLIVKMTDGHFNRVEA